MTGTILLLGAYTLAAFVDPSTLQLDSLDVTAIDPVKYVEESLDLPGTLQATPGTSEIPGEAKCDSS